VALAIALATFTGADNTHTAPEYSGGGDGKNWPHVVAHLVIAAVILPLGTATRKARAASTGTCRGTACTRPSSSDASPIPPLTSRSISTAPGPRRSTTRVGRLDT